MSSMSRRRWCTWRACRSTRTYSSLRSWRRRCRSSAEDEEEEGDHMSRHVDLRVALVAAIALAWAVAPIVAQQNPYLGRWNLTGMGQNAGVYWLEIRDEGGQLIGMFLNRGGSPEKLATV